MMLEFCEFNDFSDLAEVELPWLNWERGFILYRIEPIFSLIEEAEMNLSETFCGNIDQQLTRWLGSIPVLMPILKRLNLVEIINRYIKTEADVDNGTVASFR